MAARSMLPKSRVPALSRALRGEVSPNLSRLQFVQGAPLAHRGLQRILARRSLNLYVTWFIDRRSLTGKEARVSACAGMATRHRLLSPDHRREAAGAP